MDEGGVHLSANDSEKDSNLCVVCLEKKVSIVILPCAHLCVCPDCAGCMVQCPLCRKDFRGYVRVFLSS